MKQYFQRAAESDLGEGMAYPELALEAEHAMSPEAFERLWQSALRRSPATE